MLASSGTGTSIIRGPALRDEPGVGLLTLGGYLREITQRYGEREALVEIIDGVAHRWSYDRLWRESLTLAKALCARGVAHGTRVGLLMTNRLEFLSSLFGTVLAGGVAVPLSTFSTARELEYLLKSSCCSLLLFERNVLNKDFRQLLSQLDPALEHHAPGAVRSSVFPFLRTLVMVDEEQGAGTDKSAGAYEGWQAFVAQGRHLADAFIGACAGAVCPSDPGLIFFSSGSTDRPKGILNAHRAVALQFWRWPRLYALGDDVRGWTANGFFWSGTFSSIVGSSLTSGGAIVLQRTFNRQEALTLLEGERVTFPQAWPHQWALLEEEPSWSQRDFSAMRYVSLATPPGQHPSVNTHWDEPVHAYGNTEMFTVSAIHPSGTPEAVHRNSRGVPLPGNIFKIVDAETGVTVPIGERGEIAVKGPTLMLGYLGRPQDEVLDDEGFFRTGDAGYVDEEGRLFWEGRLNDIIKTGGANVSPLEVDEALQALSGVLVAQTVGVPHPMLGELVVACVIPSEGALLAEEEIRERLRETLASYKVPRRVLFFKEGEVELTGSAKIKTADLRKLAAARLGSVPH